MKAVKGALEKTTLFPQGNKPFNYSRREDDDEVQLLAHGQIISRQDDEAQLLALGQIISRQDDEAQLLALEQIISRQDKIEDKPEGDKDATGGEGSRDEDDDLLDNLDDDWELALRASPLPPSGRSSDCTIDLDYSSDKNETGSPHSTCDKKEQDSSRDNSSFKEQGDNSSFKELGDNSSFKELGMRQDRDRSRDKYRCKEANTHSAGCNGSCRKSGKFKTNIIGSRMGKKERGVQPNVGWV
jgi:hypothetical protein